MSIESIHNNVANALLSGKAARKDPVESKSSSTLATGVKDDTVSISSMPQGLKQLAEGDSSPVSNEARLAEIRASIKDGSYLIDPQRLAKKMLQFESKLPDTT